MDQLVRYSPSTITFSVALRKRATSHLHLRNVSDNAVAYKVKTTNTDRYCVRPNAAILDAHAEITVELVQQAFKTIPDDIHACRDRFLLQVVQLDHVPKGEKPDSAHGYDSVMEMWTAVPPHSVHKAKFQVQMHMPIALPDNLTHASAAPKTTTPKVPSPLPALHTTEQVDVPPNASVAPGPAPSVPSPEMSVPSEVKTVERAPRAEPPTASNRALSSPQKSQGSAEVEQPVLLSVATSPTASAPAHRSASTEAATTTDVKRESGAQFTTPETEVEVDYSSVEYARERALAIRTAPKISIQALDKPARQRVAVERAGELVRVINVKQKDIDAVNKELSEARHKLSDARMATRPAYDVRYEISESARVPFAQIAIMAIISGALLQLLV